MKTKWKIAVTIALLALVSVIHAGTVVDSANVFGPQSAEVNKAIADLPVWFETRVSTPSEGLKEYADAKVSVFTKKGFLVVVTTQPRAWRISMNPIGLASSESTRIAGEAMTAKFKQGQFAAGAIGLANKLNELTTPKKAMSKEDAVLLWAVGIAVFLTVAIFIGVCIQNRRERKRKERERAEIEAEERHGKFDPENMTQAQKRKAEKLFSKYTQDERRTMAVQYINTPGYNSSMTDSPFFWWWLMSSNNHPCCNDYSPPAHYTERASDYTPPAPRADPPERSSYTPSRSSSDDSGSSYSSGGGSSWSDSGSSSFDSGSSSSDSGGSSGSW